MGTHPASISDPGLDWSEGLTGAAPPFRSSVMASAARSVSRSSPVGSGVWDGSRGEVETTRRMAGWRSASVEVDLGSGRGGVWAT